MSKKVFIAFAHPKYKSGESFNSCVRDEFIKSSKAVSYTHLTLPTTPYV